MGCFDIFDIIPSRLLQKITLTVEIPPLVESYISTFLVLFTGQTHKVHCHSHYFSSAVFYFREGCVVSFYLPTSFTSFSIFYVLSDNHPCFTISCSVHCYRGPRSRSLRDGKTDGTTTSGDTVSERRLPEDPDVPSGEGSTVVLGVESESQERCESKGKGRCLATRTRVERKDVEGCRKVCTLFETTSSFD